MAVVELSEIEVHAALSIPPEELVDLLPGERLEELCRKVYRECQVLALYVVKDLREMAEANENDLNDLVVFCQTGKYPD